MYPVDAVRPLARSAQSAALSWHDANDRLVEKLAEDMTKQEFIDAAEDQRDSTLREHARVMAAFMNHDGAVVLTTKLQMSRLLRSGTTASFRKSLEPNSLTAKIP